MDWTGTTDRAKFAKNSRTASAHAQTSCKLVSPRLHVQLIDNDIGTTLFLIWWQLVEEKYLLHGNGKKKIAQTALIMGIILLSVMLP